MRVQILPVADHVFPIAALPDIALALAALRLFGRIEPPRETGFQEADARREVVIRLGQPPDKVRVLGQDDGGDGFKGMRLADIRP